MSGHDDDLPDYLRGVEQVHDDAKPQEPARAPVTPAYDDDDDDDDDYGERPPLIPPLLVLGVVGIFGVACIGIMGSTILGGSFVGSAQDVAIDEAGDLVEVVRGETKIIDGLATRGANRARLEELYGAIDDEQGLVQGLAALKYGRAIERECVQLGNLRGTPMDDQRHDIVLAVKEFEEALRNWDASSRGWFGQMAVTFGMANRPPEWRE